jgi:hypothetical protein
MHYLLRIASALALALFAAGASAASGDSEITIRNESSWVLHELYLSSVDDEEWGPDQLGSEVIGSGDEFILTHVPCEVYDVRLVDEDGDACILDAVALCNHDASWHITDTELLSCQAETDE